MTCADWTVEPPRRTVLSTRDFVRTVRFSVTPGHAPDCALEISTTLRENQGRRPDHTRLPLQLGRPPADATHHGFSHTLGDGPHPLNQDRAPRWSLALRLDNHHDQARTYTLDLTAEGELPGWSPGPARREIEVPPSAQRDPMTASGFPMELELTGPPDVDLAGTRVTLSATLLRIDGIDLPEDRRDHVTATHTVQPRISCD